MCGFRGRACTALLFSLIVFLGGCGDSTDVTRLTFRTLAEPGSDEFRLLEAIVEDFHSAHPEIRVELLGGRLRLEYLLRSVIARQAADVLDVRADEVGILAERRALARLDAECGSLATACNANAWRLGTAERKLYAVPWAARPKLLLYNKAAFGAREAPRTWHELLGAAKELTRDIDSDGETDVYGFALAGKSSADLGRHFATFLSQLGLPLLERRKATWAFNIDRTAGLRAMRFLLELQKFAPPECVVSDDASALDQFRSGRAAMVISGPGGLYCGPDGPKQADIAVASVPAPAGRPTHCAVEFRHVCVPAYVRGGRRSAALKLVRFMAGRAAQETVASGVGDCTPLISVRKDVLASSRYQERPGLRAFASALERAGPVIPSFVWEGKCSRDWIGGIHSLLIGDRRGVDEVMTVAQTRGDQALSCLYTDIGHPSATMTLGMSIVGVLVFVAVAYVISRH